MCARRHRVFPINRARTDSHARRHADRPEADRAERRKLRRRARIPATPLFQLHAEAVAALSRAPPLPRETYAFGFSRFRLTRVRLPLFLSLRQMPFLLARRVLYLEHVFNRRLWTA